LQKSGFELVFYRGNIISFGGCQLSKNCTNDLFTLNVDEICPNDCSGNGSCLENIGCICKTGFVTNDCSISIKCKKDCNKNGICHNNGKCGCFAGWFGSACESSINCQKNCTSFDNGICQADGKCLCKEGFEGEDCANYIIIRKKADFFSGEHLDLLSKISFNEIKSKEINGKMLNKTIVNSFSKKEKNAELNAKFSKNNTRPARDKCSNHGIYDEKKGKCFCDVIKFLFFYL